MKGSCFTVRSHLSNLPSSPSAKIFISSIVFPFDRSSSSTYLLYLGFPGLLLLVFLIVPILCTLLVNLLECVYSYAILAIVSLFPSLQVLAMLFRLILSFGILSHFIFLILFSFY
mgnify:CR=1 FL=1